MADETKTHAERFAAYRSQLSTDLSYDDALGGVLDLAFTDLAALERRLAAATAALEDVLYFLHLSAHTTDWTIASAVERFIRGEVPSVRETADAEIEGRVRTANPLAAALEELASTDRGRKRLWSIKHLHALERAHAEKDTTIAGLVAALRNVERYVVAALDTVGLRSDFEAILDIARAAIAAAEAGAQAT